MRSGCLFPLTRSSPILLLFKRAMETWSLPRQRRVISSTFGEGEWIPLSHHVHHLLSFISFINFIGISLIVVRCPESLGIGRHASLINDNDNINSLKKQVKVVFSYFSFKLVFFFFSPQSFCHEYYLGWVIDDTVRNWNLTSSWWLF